MSRLPTPRPRTGSGSRPPRATPLRRAPLRAADPEDPRRTDTMSAGRVLAVMVAALAAAAVLNAQALLEDAKGQPLGTGRTVSVAIWSPVARVAAAFGLDRPRNAAEAALGRDSDVEPITVQVPDTGAGTSVDAGVALPPEVAAPSAPEQAPTVAGQTGPLPLPPATPEDKLQVLLVGDSTMTQLSGALTRQLAATNVAETEIDARPATGFSRPDFFDWPTRLAELTAPGTAELTIAMFGANDAQGFEWDGDVHEFGSPSWSQIYRARVGVAMDLLVARGNPVLWIGQPVMRSGQFDAKVRLIDDIIRSEAALRPAIRYVDARSILGDDNGAYREYHTTDDGDRDRIRDSDGIHMTTEGAELLASAVLEPVIAQLTAG